MSIVRAMQTRVYKKMVILIATADESAWYRSL